MRRKLPMHIGEMSSVPEWGTVARPTSLRKRIATPMSGMRRRRRVHVLRQHHLWVERYARPRCPNRVEPYAKSTPTARAANAGIPRLESSGTAHAGLTCSYCGKNGECKQCIQGGHLISAPRNACPTARPSLPRCRTASSTPLGQAYLRYKSPHVTERGCESQSQHLQCLNGKMTNCEAIVDPACEFEHASC